MLIPFLRYLKPYFQPPMNLQVVLGLESVLMPGQLRVEGLGVTLGAVVGACVLFFCAKRGAAFEK